MRTQCNFDTTTIQQYVWSGGVLPALLPDKNAPPAQPTQELYRRVEPLWVATSSQSFPLDAALDEAQRAAAHIRDLVATKNLEDLEAYIAAVSFDAHKLLCNFYNVPHDSTEVVYDDNATLVTYQFLSMLNLGNNPTLVSCNDIGHTMKQTLCGLREERPMYSSKPAVDVWGSSAIDHSQAGSVGPFNTLLIDTFSGTGYQTDDDFIRELRHILHTHQPQVFIIPTLTSSGRLLPFKEACRMVADYRKTHGHYKPTIILDDAQGILRIPTASYPARMWDEVDAILTTGAKALGALPGSSAMLMYTEHFKKHQRPFADSPLVYRARKYGFVSTDRNRLQAYIDSAPRIANTPEIASLIAAMQYAAALPNTSQALLDANAYIRQELAQIPGITLVTNKTSAPSIVTFYITNELKGAQQLRDSLLVGAGNDYPNNLPGTLPKLIETDKIDYLRISLDPQRIRQPGYTERLPHIIKRINTYMAVQ